MATQEELNELRNKILKQMGSPLGPGVMSNKDQEMLEYNKAINTPGTIEYNIEQIRKNMERETQISPERQAFIDARQEIIDEVLMPLSNAGYKELVDIILTKPKDSAEHDQASMELAKIAAQMDDEFDSNEFDMMINMVSKEPRPSDLINPEGLPDKNAETIRVEQQGIGTLE